MHLAHDIAVATLARLFCLAMAFYTALSWHMKILTFSLSVIQNNYKPATSPENKLAVEH